MTDHQHPPEDGGAAGRLPRPGPPRGHQGFVVVGSVLLLLGMVIGTTSSGFHWSTSSAHRSDQAAATSTTAKRRAGSGPSAPPTTVIEGATSLFVTTTVPLTTTSSTTTTSTVPRGGLVVLSTPLTLGVDHRSATVQLANTSKKALSWAASASLGAVRLVPASGRLRSGQLQRVSVTYVGAVPSTTSGTISFRSSGRGGGTVTVTVEAAVAPLVLSAPVVQPSPPVCAEPIQITVSVSGGVAVSVVLTLASPGGLGSRPLSPSNGGTWTTTIPALPGGTQASGSVVATDAAGDTAHTGLQFAVRHVSGVC